MTKALNGNERVRVPQATPTPTDRQPTRKELIEAIRAANLRSKAIQGTEADPLVQARQAAERVIARSDALLAEIERYERSRWRSFLGRWPFG